MSAADEFDMVAYDAEHVTCPRCGAPPNIRCRNPITETPFSGPAHWQRLRDAQQQQTEPT